MGGWILTWIGEVVYFVKNQDTNEALKITAANDGVVIESSSDAVLVPHAALTMVIRALQRFERFDGR